MKLFNFMKQKKVPDNQWITSPLSGTVMPLASVPDDVFAGGTMGDGIAIVPNEGKLRSCISGEVALVFPTGHAYGLKSPDGTEILIHIGIDTVSMDGEGFYPKVKTGDKVKQGDLLGEFSLDKIQKAGFNPVTMILVTRTSGAGALCKTAAGFIAAGERLMWLDSQSKEG